MSREAMEMESVSEQSPKQKAETLQALATGPLASSVAKLSGSSRCIPSDKDFHFFYNFDEFKVPIKEIAEKSELVLKSIGSSGYLWGKQMVFPEDPDEAYDWLVNVNDEVFERFDVSVDDFQRLRKKEEETGRRIVSVESENGFQLVYGKKKKGGSNGNMEKEKEEEQDSRSLSSVKMASRDKKTTGSRPRIPFHIPTIPRPQDEFNILVNNSNQPFEHVWLQKSEGGSRFIHPLERLSELDFIDRTLGDIEPVKPLPLENTLFKIVEEVRELKELAAKLCDVNEFAVDLEHNQYRSFQGMTCLMQISTRTEDFVVDTLKLRIHIGPYLREVFKDPSKRKVMHGADRDIVWLQRDFGIYICNLFDTGQASRVLQLERNSLEYLLYHFCGVTANKEYQNADWRLRPLPDEMLKYAREDTHYLLNIYDIMRGMLLSASSKSENSEDLLLEVYKRSYDVCMQLYEKELLTDTSYLYIYGLQGADFNAQQLAIVAGLCEWRDVIARAEDESTGYILPNKALLEIARQMPLITGKLRPLVRSKHPYVERNLGAVVSVIKHSIKNAAAFESAVEQLKKGRVETAPEKNVEIVLDDSEGLPAFEAPSSIQTASAQTKSINGEDGKAVNGKMAESPAASMHVKEESLVLSSSTVECGRYEQGGSVELLGDGRKIKKEWDSSPSELTKESVTVLGQIGVTNTERGTSCSMKAVTGATVQVLKKPSRAFGALLGNSAPKRKLDQDKAEKKVEQIKSLVHLPFNSFSDREELLKPFFEKSAKPLEIMHPEQPVGEPAEISTLEDIISLDTDLHDQKSTDDDPLASNDDLEHRKNDGMMESTFDTDTGEEPMSLSDLSSSFQDCFKSINERRNSRHERPPKESHGYSQLKPFDYAAARKQVRFGEEKRTDGDEPRERRKSSGKSRALPSGEATQDFQQGRRRQAFPATGNRSATFR